MKRRFMFIGLFMGFTCMWSYSETVFDLNGPEGLQILAPEGYELAEYSIGTTVGALGRQYRPIVLIDEKGITVNVSGQKKEGIQFLAGPVFTGKGPVLIQCYVCISHRPKLSDQNNIGIAVLNVPSGQNAASIGDSLATTLYNTRDIGAGWEIVSLLYDPPGDSLIPLIQYTAEPSNSPGFTGQEVFISQLVITPLRELSVEQILKLFDLNFPVAPTPTPTVTPVPEPDEYSNPFSGAIFFDGLSPFSVLHANADGIPDMLFKTSGRNNDEQWSYAFGNGDGLFAEPIQLLTLSRWDNSYPNEVLIADFNGDGIDDILFYDVHTNPFEDQETSIYFVSEGGAYRKSAFSPALDDIIKAAAADFNNDGYMDLAVYHLSDGMRFLYGDSNGEFVTSRFSVKGLGSVRNIFVEDYNQDGILDFSAYDTTSFYLCLGSDTRFYSVKIDHPLGGNVYDLSYCDLNGDGIRDILYTDQTCQIFVCWGTASGDFSDPELLRTDNQVIQLDVVDLNLDSVLDIVAGGIMRYRDILFGKGNGEFAQTVQHFGGYSYSGLADLNQDSFPDMITSRAVAMNQLGNGPQGTPSEMVLPESDQLAVDTINQLLEHHRPWLFPSPIHAEYDYEVNGNSTHYSLYGGGMTPRRVGTYCVNVLHNLAYHVSPYTAKILKSSEMEMEIEIVFQQRGRGYFQFGGHENTNYAKVDYALTKARILVDLIRMAPVMIKDDFSTWIFDEFFEIDGGLAPESIHISSNYFSEEQIYQIIDGVWILHHGSATSGINVKLADFSLIEKL